MSGEAATSLEAAAGRLDEALAQLERRLLAKADSRRTADTQELARLRAENAALRRTVAKALTSLDGLIQNVEAAEK